MNKEKQKKIDDYLERTVWPYILDNILTDEDMSLLKKYDIYKGKDYALQKATIIVSVEDYPSIKLEGIAIDRSNVDYNK